MKKLFIFASILVLSACAKERTTKYYSTLGQPKTGAPITSVLTNEDYEKQQEEKNRQKLNRKKDPIIKPVEHPETIITLKEDSDQEDLAVLFDAYNVTEVQLPGKKGEYDYLPQLRIQKTLGRLSCIRQSVISSVEEVVRSSTRYSCEVNTSRNSKDIWTEDKELYELLNIDEVEMKDQKEGTRAFSKTAGRFTCEKAIEIKSGDVAYRCGVPTDVTVINIPNIEQQN